MKEEIKRICIYLTFDKQKIVDRYIGYMLKELKTCVDYLVVVCNETEVIRGNEILTEYADEIFFRENIGFDAGGFKDALCKYIGWNRILKYDELVLCNDSMFGPFKPMRDIFLEMNEKKMDFWGLIKHSESIYDDLGHIPEHIQSFFYVIRFKMLHHSMFREYWNTMPYFTTFIDTVKGHELKFTQFFSKLNFTYDVLAQVQSNNTLYIKNNYSQYAHIPYELIKKRNFPFIKKQPFVREILGVQTQENLKLSLEYIDSETDYDIDLIWENIIRIFNASELQRNLHLQFIISQSHFKVKNQSVIFLVYIDYINSIEYILESIKEISVQFQVNIISDNQKCLIQYRKKKCNYNVIYVNNRIEPLIKYAHYDYMCVLHDVDMSSDQKSSYIGKSFYFNIWENMVKDRRHVLGILEQFSKEKRLGFLTSPQPNFGNCFGNYGRKWNESFREVFLIIERLKLNCQLSEDIPPFCVVNNFWIRGKILKKLKYIEMKDYIYLPYLWIYLAQDAGYYSGIVESPEYASMNEVNLEYYLRETVSDIWKYWGRFDSFFEFREKLHLLAAQNYCKSYSKVLIYGAGKMALDYGDFFSNIEAYIVSDGQYKMEELNGKTVKYFSEICTFEDYGIVLCVNKENQKQIIPKLEEKGIKHYFCI